jgi:hypothetical protein
MEMAMTTVPIDAEELEALREIEACARAVVETAGPSPARGWTVAAVNRLDAIRARAKQGEMLPGAYEFVCFDCQGTWIGKSQTPPAVVPICGRCGKACTGGHWVLPKQAEGDLVPIGRPPSVTLTAEQAEQLIGAKQAECTCWRSIPAIPAIPAERMTLAAYCPRHGSQVKRSRHRTPNATEVTLGEGAHLSNDCTCGRHALALEPDPDCPLHGTRAEVKCTCGANERQPYHGSFCPMAPRGVPHGTRGGE